MMKLHIMAFAKLLYIQRAGSGLDEYTSNSQRCRFLDHLQALLGVDD